MLRGGKLEFQESMVEVLYDAFDEVVNLIEAAEETGDIVEADEETVDTAKVNFHNPEVDETFCSETNFYAVVFDIDDSCMVYGNDPVYTLSLLGDKVLGVFSCMSDENAKGVLSGTEDEDGLLLKTSIVAFIHATYEEIEDSLFNFIDELVFLPLDISTLLSISRGDTGLQIDSLKELAGITDDLDLNAIKDEVANVMELVGVETIQYAKMERFLDIVGLIKEEDREKLGDFFDSLASGEVYSAGETTADVVEVVTSEPEVKEETKFEVSPEELDENITSVLQGIFEQQKRAIEYIESDEDLLRIVVTLENARKYIPDMPELTTLGDVESFLNAQLGLEDSVSEKVEVAEAAKETKAAAVVETKVEEVSTPAVESKPVVEAEVVKTPTAKAAKAVVKKEPKEEKQKAVVGKTVKVEQE